MRDNLTLGAGVEGDVSTGCVFFWLEVLKFQESIDYLSRFERIDIIERLAREVIEVQPFHNQVTLAVSCFLRRRRGDMEEGTCDTWCNIGIWVVTGGQQLGRRMGDTKWIFIMIVLAPGDS